MDENDVEGLFRELPFRPASEGHYLRVASYELRRAICTERELDKYARQFSKCNWASQIARNECTTLLPDAVRIISLENHNEVSHHGWDVVQLHDAWCSAGCTPLLNCLTIWS